MNINEIMRDFRTKYQGTFVFAKNPETCTEVLCKLEEISEDADRNAVLSLMSREHGRLVLNMASSHSLLFKFPKVGTFQMGKDSFLVMRQPPHRTYTRGFYSNNHTMNNCMAGVIPGLAKARWALETVQAAFDGKKMSATEAANVLHKGKARSVALKDRWSLAQPFSEGAKQLVLMHGLDYVGQVDDNLVFTPTRGCETIAAEASRILVEI